jgi:predicted phage terminase large subunit-like protein
VRFWDRAATEPTEGTDPDYTAGVKLSKLVDGRFYVEHVERFRYSPFKRDQIIKNTATTDSVAVEIVLEQEPGASGKAEISYIIGKLAGFRVTAVSATGDKVTRAGPASSQAEAGNILVRRAEWNKAFFEELTNFPDGNHDDQVDALSGAFNALAQPVPEPDIR